MEKSAKQLILSFFLLVFASGCSTIEIPTYIQAEHPYKRTYAVGFDKALDGVILTMTDQGWLIKTQSKPSVFEHSYSSVDSAVRQLLIISETKKIPYFLGTRYVRFNVILTSNADAQKTDIELRYLTIKSLFFVDFNHYKRDMSANHFFQDLEEFFKEDFL